MIHGYATVLAFSLPFPQSTLQNNIEKHWAEDVNLFDSTLDIITSPASMRRATLRRVKGPKQRNFRLWNIMFNQISKFHSFLVPNTGNNFKDNRRVVNTGASSKTRKPVRSINQSIELACPWAAHLGAGDRH